MEVNLTNLIQVVITVQAVFGVALLLKNGRFFGLNLFLMFFAVLMTINFLEEVIGLSTKNAITPLFSLGIGPAFYLFIISIVYKKPMSLKNSAGHFAPLLLSLPLLQWPIVVLILGSISQLIYLCVALYKLRRYHKASESMRSDAFDMRLHWIYKLLLLFIVVGVFDNVRLVSQSLISPVLNNAGQMASSFAALFIISYLIYKALNQPKLFDGLDEYEKLYLEPEVTNNESEIYQSIFESIDAIIREKELFKQHRLSLKDLSDHSGLNTRDISQAINSQYQKSFCDYINHFRVKAIQDEMISGAVDYESILDLALRMGFSSKSNFNLVFKKYTSVTPSQYYKSIANS